MEQTAEFCFGRGGVSQTKTTSLVDSTHILEATQMLSITFLGSKSLNLSQGFLTSRQDYSRDGSKTAFGS